MFWTINILSLEYFWRAREIIAEDSGSVPCYLDGSSQPSLTPCPQDPTPSPHLLHHSWCTWCTYIHTGKTTIHINLKNKRKPLITALGEISEIRLVYRVSSRTSRAAQRNPVWKTKKEKKRTENCLALSEFLHNNLPHKFTISCYGFTCMSHESVFCLNHILNCFTEGTIWRIQIKHTLLYFIPLKNVTLVSHIYYP